MINDEICQSATIAKLSHDTQIADKLGLLQLLRTHPHDKWGAVGRGGWGEKGSEREKKKEERKKERKKERKNKKKKKKKWTRRRRRQTRMKHKRLHIFWNSHVILM